ncbi:hypothetical protein [Peribacillus alkalitolerans]|uniref:hypothetical protein n=1 Tax=Peribacillus alkalitolerans TaxID=1550385 RepID=UPI0013D21146|nr:hypothetical protein [Peribacillus alkalitolerans]
MRSKKVSKLISVFTIILLISALFPQVFSGKSTVVEAKSWDSYSEKIMAKDIPNLALELEIQGVLKLAKNYKVFQRVDGKLYHKSLNDVRVGAENIAVLVNHKKEVTKIYIDGPTPIKNMRVGIMTTNFVSTDHNLIKMSSPTGLTIVDKVANETLVIGANESITFTPNSHEITVTKDDNTVLHTSKNRLYISTDESSKIAIGSIIDRVLQSLKGQRIEAFLK